MGKPLRILIVEDSKDDALLVVETLNSGGHEVAWERVDTPADMASALEAKQWDAVIADHGMPKFSAPAALEVLKENKLDLPFIIVSGTIGEDVAVEAMKSGAHDYILKDNLARLVPAIERELREAEVRCERKRAEESIEISRRFLEIANRHMEMTPLLEEFVEGIRDYMGCGALGVRVFDKQGNLSHQAYSGFPGRFYEIECPLAAESDRCRVCEVVLKGETDPGLSAFTDAGSFYMNTPADFPPDVSKGTDVDNLCIGFGYKSVALVPIRMWDRTLGLIHVADAGENMIPERHVEILEEAARILGPAVARVETQQALGESESKYRELVENMSDVVYMGDENGILTYIGPVIEAYTGFRPDELVGRSFDDFIYHEDLPEFIAKRKNILAGGTETNEYRLVTRDGGIRWIRTSSRPIIKDDRVVGLHGLLSDIDGRKRAEEALRLSEERYRRILDTSPNNTLVVDEYGRVLYANRSWQLDSGYALDEAMSMEGFNIVHPDDIEKAAEAFLAARDGKQVRNVEYRRMTKSGEARWVETNLDPIHWPGVDKALVSVSQDITDRKKAEDALRDSEERYRMLVESANDMIFTLDPETRKISSINSYGLENLKYIEEEIVGKMSIRDLVHPDDLEEAARSFSERIGENLRHPNFAFRLRRADGSYIDAEVNGALVRDSEGKPETYIGIVRDVTERKRAEEALKESEERYRTLVENSLTGVYVRHEDRFLFLNDRVVEILKFSREELLGMSLFEVVHPDDRERAREQAARRDAGGGSAKPIQYRTITKDGDVHWIETLGRKITYQGKPAVLAYVADITERKQAEQAIRESEERYRTLFENTPIQIVVVDSRGVVTAINRARRASADKPPEAGDRMYIDYASLHQLDMRAELMDCIASGAPKEFPEQPYGRRILSIRMSPFPGGAIIISEDISERKRSEDWLKRSHSLLSATLESTADGIMVVDMQGNMLSSNHRFVEMWRIPEHVMASQDDEQVRSFFLEQLKNPEEALKEESEIYADPEREHADILEFKDGRILERYTRPQKMGGKNVGIVFSFRDVTERRRAERALEGSLSLLNATLESTADGILVVGMNGVYHDFNSRFVEMWSLTPEMMESLDESEILTICMNQTTEPERNIERMKEISADQDLERMDILEFKDGRVVERYSRPQKLGGKTVGKVLTFHDITDLKRAEEKLQERMRLNQLLLDALPCVALLLRPGSHEVVASNKAGRDVGAVPGKQCFATFGQREDPCPWCLAPESWAVGEPEHLEIEAIGVVWDAHWIPLGPDLYLHYAFDITEKKQTEKSILENQEQLRSLTSELSLAEERERRRIANQLHDRVGQSLLASKLKLGTARDSNPPPAIEEPLNEAYKLIDQTIQDVRLLTFELSPPILYMLGFEAAVEWLTEQAEKQYGIACRMDDDGLPKPLGDDMRVILFQNVRELLVNVCKHSQAHNAKVSIRRENDTIRVSVEDDGVGFDASRVGTHWDETCGFGLFSIRERLRHLAGEFEIDSEPGRGTRVTLRAPLKTDEETTEGETT